MKVTQNCTSASGEQSVIMSQPCLNCQLSHQAPESSPASEALQLIFADSGLDGKSIMLDLSKLLNEDPNLANQVQTTTQTNLFVKEQTKKVTLNIKDHAKN